MLCNLFRALSIIEGTPWNNRDGPSIVGSPTSFEIPKLRSAMICIVNLSVASVVFVALL